MMDQKIAATKRPQRVYSQTLIAGCRDPSIYSKELRNAVVSTGKINLLSQMMNHKLFSINYIKIIQNFETIECLYVWLLLHQKILKYVFPNNVLSFDCVYVQNQQTNFQKCCFI